MNSTNTGIELGKPKQSEFETLFEEFLETYPDTEGGRHHIAWYERTRERGRKNYEKIVAAADRGEDITDQVLLKLLPYDNTASNREKGAWIPLAPAIQGNLRGWYEKMGWIDPEDWPRVAEAILRFIQRCDESPGDLRAACEWFDGLTYISGFQTGMLTPILNALHPDKFLLINSKSRKTINHFADTSYGQKLVEYPETNATGLALIHALAPMMHSFNCPDLRDQDLFDMFCHWLVAEKDYDFRSTSESGKPDIEPKTRQHETRQGIAEIKGTKYQSSYTLEQCAADTYLDVTDLRRWTRAIERKKQAILYGPPGTGKTYLAEHLAKHLIGGGDGFSEVVQLHPAYTYEDFIQGLRPVSNEEGHLHFKRVPGRFLDFCQKADARDGLCVLIIDEINRANLSRVFGELMYLLEYRDRSVPLAGGGEFSIPENVRIIGTMNTADRSIALVDHALRRRFAFLALYPDFDVLRRYHENRATGFDVEPLITVLKQVNRQIDDKHYEVGITFFLDEDLAKHIADVWQMEIEPYLDEYFFDQPGKVEQFRWNEIKPQVSP